jgi:hypothetical protein
MTLSDDRVIVQDQHDKNNQLLVDIDSKNDEDYEESRNDHANNEPFFGKDKSSAPAEIYKSY